MAEGIMMAGLFIGIAIFLSALVFSTAMFMANVTNTAIMNFDKITTIDKEIEFHDDQLVGGTCRTVSPDYRNECCERKNGMISTYDQEIGECITIVAK